MTCLHFGASHKSTRSTSQPAMARPKPPLNIKKLGNTRNCPHRQVTSSFRHEGGRGIMYSTRSGQSLLRISWRGSVQVVPHRNLRQRWDNLRRYQARYARPLYNDWRRHLLSLHSLPTKRRVTLVLLEELLRWVHQGLLRWEKATGFLCWPERVPHHFWTDCWCFHSFIYWYCSLKQRLYTVIHDNKERTIVFKENTWSEKYNVSK